MFLCHFTPTTKGRVKGYFFPNFRKLPNFVVRFVAYGDCRVPVANNVDCAVDYTDFARTEAFQRGLHSADELSFSFAEVFNVPNQYLALLF